MRWRGARAFRSRRTPPARSASRVDAWFLAPLSVGDRVYKLKKPVNLGFIDFSERAVRQRVCDQEVALNSRFAPDVYIGVADVLGPDGEMCDHLVIMRRMPANRRLATLVTQDHDVDDALRAVARRLAIVHAGSQPTAEMSATSTAEAVGVRWTDSIRELRRSGGGPMTQQLASRVGDLALRYLRGRGPLFEQRIADGWIRDGHGDLRADDIFCLDDGPRILDCIEFDHRLRWGDALSDAAFLAMDLERLDRPDLAQQFLDLYQEFSSGQWPSSLQHHYIAYRAHVRAKVDCIRSRQQNDHAAAKSAVRHLEIARAHLLQGRVQLVLVGGLPGSGKSTVANGLADVGVGTVTSSDQTRKHLAGMSSTTASAAGIDEGLYQPELVDNAYDEMLVAGRRLLSLGETVVLDASFISARHRMLARHMASDAYADVVELQRVCSPEVAQRRLEARPPGQSASDATPAIRNVLAIRQEPWREAVVRETSRPLAESIDQAVGCSGARATRSEGRPPVHHQDFRPWSASTRLRSTWGVAKEDDVSAEEEQALVFDDRTEMEVLGHDACFDLLRSEMVGRIAFWDRPEITIIPVNYVVDDGRILFRTAGGAKLSSAIDGREVAFEVDGLDLQQRTGWSVVVHGALTVIRPDDDQRLSGLGLRPWARAPKENWVTVDPRRITGRRILTVAQQHRVGPYQRVRVPSGPPSHLRQAP